MDGATREVDYDLGILPKLSESPAGDVNAVDFYSIPQHLLLLQHCGCCVMKFYSGSCMLRDFGVL